MTSRTLISIFLLYFGCALTMAQTGQDVIEHKGDRYIIHVDAMHPDADMTLMDVLQTCPELISANGKRITEYYDVQMDGNSLVMDDETLLNTLRACEISTIEIYVYTSVTQGGDATGGIIDIYLKEQDEDHTSGKLHAEGSTRGNGKLYADIHCRRHDVTVSGYALANMGYARGTAADDSQYRARRGLENVHLKVDWDISERDELVVKMHQNFFDSNMKFDGSEVPVIPVMQRYWAGLAEYTRTLNEAGATLSSEGGADFLSADEDGYKQHSTGAYFNAEAALPFLDDALNVTAGWEVDYFNTLTTGRDRQQMLFNDIYLQLEYTQGPWVLTVGDRLRVIHYWHRDYYFHNFPLWHNRSTENSYLLSAGYKARRHYVQGVFSHDFYAPIIDEFYTSTEDGLEGRRDFMGFQTNLVWRSELRYAYQREGFILTGSLLHTWSDYNQDDYNQQYTGLRAAATWHKGPWRLTAAADYFHELVDYPDNEGPTHDNYFSLRLLPTLTLPHAWRLSATLLYNSRRSLLDEARPHLYAAVKVSKQLAPGLTLSADFHDIAGTPHLPAYMLWNSFDNRALTIALTYRY